MRVRVSVSVRVMVRVRVQRYLAAQSCADFDACS